MASLATFVLPSLAAAQGFPDGYFKLTSQFRDGANECLESTSHDNSAGANMDPCSNVSGQLWKATSAGNGYYKLTTQFREGANECLESTSHDNSAGANMDPCSNVSVSYTHLTLPTKA